MLSVRMMQVPRDQVVDVIAMRHRRMPAAGTMLVLGAVRVAGVTAGAFRRIRRRHPEHMLVDMITVLMMQMPVVQIIDVPVVPHSEVTAIVAVHMRVAFVNLASHHPKIYHTCTVAQVYNRSVDGRLLLIGDYQ